MEFPLAKMKFHLPRTARLRARRPPLVTARRLSASPAAPYPASDGALVPASITTGVPASAAPTLPELPPPDVPPLLPVLGGVETTPVFPVDEPPPAELGRTPSGMQHVAV